MIHCEALETNSLYVTSNGDILPCCHIYRSGPKLTPILKKIVEEENFDGLVKSWSSDEPYIICYQICDDTQTSNPKNIVNFYKQWK